MYETIRGGVHDSLERISDLIQEIILVMDEQMDYVVNTEVE